MKNKIAFKLIKLLNETKILDSLKNNFKLIQSVQDEIDNIYINVRLSKSKEISNFEKKLDSSLSNEEMDFKKGAFFESLLSEENKLEIIAKKEQINDYKFEFINVILDCLDRNENVFYEFIGAYKNIQDISKLENMELEETIDVINEVMSDKSFLALKKFVK